MKDVESAIVLDGWVSWLKALVFKLTKNGGKVMSVDRLRGDKNGHRHRKSKRHSMRWRSMSRMMQLCQKGALSNPPMRWCKKVAALFLVGLFLCAAISRKPKTERTSLRFPMLASFHTRFCNDIMSRRCLHLLYITRLGTYSSGWFIILIRSATLGPAGVHGLPKEAPSRADVMVLSIFMPFDADKPFATPPAVTPNF
jgi:hypothetical protein